MSPLRLPMPHLMELGVMVNVAGYKHGAPTELGVMVNAAASLLQAFLLVCVYPPIALAKAVGLRG